jgi:hypothetical protein
MPLTSKILKDVLISKFLNISEGGMNMKRFRPVRLDNMKPPGIKWH